jgi:hypothetical protein
MDKRKLIQIITKDLEELKFLTEEVTDSVGDATLIIDLAHSKARLICQEIELLRELSVPVKKVQEDDEEDLVDEEESEIDDSEYHEPELEILNFEEGNELAEPETNDIQNDDIESESEENQEPEPEEDEEIEENIPEVEEPDQEDNIEEDLAEEENAEEEKEEEVEKEEIVYEDDEEEEDDLVEEEAEENEEDEEEKPVQQKNIQFTELDSEPKPKYREINIDDSDDDDIETIQFESHKSTSERPVMVEIPKPENQNQEKAVIGETFQKERSLNDAIGEQKSTESVLTNGPISSLRAAIGLNDRFLFIREIFNNNTEKYNTVIENLDKLETIQQAVEYLKANLSLQKNDTSMKFVELLKRRFSK